MANSDIQIIVGANIGSTTTQLRDDLKAIASLISRENSIQVRVGIDEGFTKDTFNKQLADIMKSIDSKDYEIKVKTNAETFTESIKTVTKTKVPEIEIKTVVDTGKLQSELDKEIAKFEKKEIQIFDMTTTKDLFALITKVQNLTSGFEKVDIGFDESTLANFQKAQNLFEILSNSIERNKLPIQEQKALFQEYAIAISKAKDEVSIMSTTLKTATDAQKELAKLEISTAEFDKANKSIELIKSSFYSLTGSIEEANRLTLQYTNALDNIKALPIEQQKDAYKSLLDNLQTVANFQEKLSLGAVEKELSNIASSITKVKIDPEITESFTKLIEQFKLFESLEFAKLPLEEQIPIINNYNNELKKVSNEIKAVDNIQKASTWVENQENKFKQASRTLEEYINKFGKIKQDTKLMSQVEEIRILINSGDVANLGKITDLTKQLKFDAREAGVETETFGQKLTQVAEKYGIFLTLGTVIRQVTSAIKDMVGTVIELDNQLTNLRMITGASSNEVQEMAKGYQGLAKELSSTTLEVAVSAETFLRQGKSFEETNELIRASQVFSKIAFLDSAQAAELLTSSLNGYGIAASDVMSIVDKMSAIDMAAATSSQELAEAMQRTATVAKLAGLSYDEILSYIATVSETSRQSADIIGTAFRSIVSRIQDVQLGKLLSEDGEDIKLVSFAA